MSLHWHDLKELQVLSPCAQLAQCFGRKKTAVAVALVRTGSGQAIAKGIVAYFQKYIDEASKKEIKDGFCSSPESLELSWEDYILSCEQVVLPVPASRSLTDEQLKQVVAFWVTPPEKCRELKYYKRLRGKTSKMNLHDLLLHVPVRLGSWCFGRKKTAVAVALVRTGSGQVRLNGCPLHTVKPDILRVKALTFDDFCMYLYESASEVDIRLRVKGGGFTGQIYALRQATLCDAIAKGIVAYFQKYIDEASKKEIKDGFRSSPESLAQDILMAYDRSLIVADPRRCEPKKFGGSNKRTTSWKDLRNAFHPMMLHVTCICMWLLNAGIL
eukprot:Skav223225  [mRNA]  locus=scaffold2231:180116:183376:+ [translate_table: standard]